VGRKSGRQKVVQREYLRVGWKEETWGKTSVVLKENYLVALKDNQKVKRRAAHLGN
jgi:hypothetical protein